MYIIGGGAGGLGRLAPGGTESEVPFSNVPGTVTTSIASSRGIVYFSATEGTTDVPSLYRIAPGGAITKLLTWPTTGNLDNLTIDFGGNVWLIDGYVNNNHVYSYNVATGRLGGPFEPNLLSDVENIFIGSDDNIWFDQRTDLLTGHILGVYVRHVQTLEPAAVAVTAGGSQSFTILETHFNGPWTAISSNPAIASVSPATSATGTFTISETGKGTTTVAVHDRIGNYSYETVTAR